MAESLFGRPADEGVEEPASTEKLDQAVVLYMGPELLDKAGKKAVVDEPGAACGKCMMFLKDTSECSILKPSKVDAYGVCGLFVGGAPATSKEHPPMKLVPQETAGYSDDGPTRCGTCAYFEEPSACAKVSGEVDENGCCNGYERTGSGEYETESGAGALGAMLGQEASE